MSKYNKINKLCAYLITWSIMDMRHIKRLGQEQNDLIVLTLVSSEAITLGNCLLSGH